MTEVFALPLSPRIKMTGMDAIVVEAAREAFSFLSASLSSTSISVPAAATPAPDSSRFTLRSNQRNSPAPARQSKERIPRSTHTLVPCR